MKAHSTNSRPGFRVVNSVKGQRAKARAPENWIKLQIKNDAADGDAAEILMYEPIGSDPWEGGGLTAKNFKSVLDQVPKGKDLHIRINSRGGDVHEGMAIKNLLDEYPGKVTCTIDGVAASTASWIPMGCDEIRASKNSQMFIHDAMSFGMGNAEEFRKAADDLDKTSDQIAGMYAEKTGKGLRTMRQMMKNETLLTGEEAEELGLVDTLTGDKAIHNFTADELSKMKAKLAAQNSASQGGGQTNDTVMNKKKIIAILNKHGVTAIDGQPISEQTPDDKLEAALNQVLEKGQQQNAGAGTAAGTAGTGATGTQAANAGGQAAAGTGAAVIVDLVGVTNRLKELEDANKTLLNANTEAKRIRVTEEVDKLVNDDRLPANLKQKAIDRAMKDDSYLDELRALPSRPPGAEPLNASKVELVSEAFSDVQNFMLTNGPRFSKQFIRNNADKIADGTDAAKKICREMRDRAVQVGNAYKKHKNMLKQMFNTNNIDAELQRVVILQEMLEEFAVILLPLQDFSVVFNNVPLEGTDKVAVPFFPLQAAASNSWDPTAGYNTFADTNEQMRDVAVGGSGANAAANTAKDRKYIGMKFQSYELRRQPYLNLQKLAVQNARKLGVDIFSDIVSRVITAGNFGVSIKSVAPQLFTGDDIADLWENATGRNWPETGRSLTLTHTYKTPLLKDPTFKQYLAYGSTDPLRKAQIQEAYGFEDIHIVPNLVNYSPAGQNLVGWIAWMYAVLIATSPIMPTEEVRQLLTRYDVVVDPSTGIAFEYRRFGDTTLDQTKEVVECSYGASLGVASALARLTSQ